VNKERLRRAVREIRVIAIILVGVLAARSTLADHYHVPSGSMEPTLISGDRVFVDKLAHGLRVPFTNLRITAGEAVQRGEVVIFDSPRDGKRLIKRIVAVGGDDVVIQNGHLLINGKPMAIGGDHRGNSVDGRVFGLIDENEVYGRAIAVYYRRGDGFTWRNL